MTRQLTGAGFIAARNARATAQVSGISNFCGSFAERDDPVQVTGEFYGVDAEGNVVQVDHSSAVRQVQLPEGYFNDRLFEPYGENRNLGNPNAGLNGERACLPVALARERYRGRAGEDLVVNPEWPTQLLVNPQTGRRAQPGDAGAETYNVVYCPPPVRLGKFVFLVKNNYYQEEEFCQDAGSGRSSGRSPAELVAVSAVCGRGPAVADSGAVPADDNRERESAARKRGL